MNLFSVMFPKLISFEVNTAYRNCSIITKKLEIENVTRNCPSTTSITQVIAEGGYIKSTRD